ncbi:MAG TPA: MBL fold metallo-hydrolase [Streptosporangiaceae bacterium]|nr:MBL fold metallo-hydrolase [Streptosporangiaceae bacterium]
MTQPSFGPAGSAQVSVLHEGYVREESGGDRVGSTVSLIMDAGRVIVVDPGMVSSAGALLDALAALGPGPGDVTDVVFSHHHPDHTINAARFPRATIHDHWASYDGDLWIGREPGDFELTPSVRLIATPGHTAEDITTLVATPDGVYACTHAWWGPDGPAEDPLATDQAALAESRRRILAVASVIVPGHGPAFRPGGHTPR